MTNYKSGIILLSGGLDCTVALSCSKNINLALTFDYGQKAFDMELKAAKKIADYYGIEHKMIELPWLKKLINYDIPSVDEKDLSDENKLKNSSKNVWVPNRNSVFINIAAAFCDSEKEKYDAIIIGANSEEAENFPDNSKNFIDKMNELLAYSTQSAPKVYAPLIDCNKDDIIKKAIENNAPLDLIYSCYRGDKKHCKHCESCVRLLRAMKSLDEATFAKLNKIYFEEE